MAFLLQTDYDVFIKRNILEEILQDTNVTLATAEMFAQGQITSYLRDVYDVVNIFNKAGNDRQMDIVEKMLHLVLYKIHKPLAPHQIPQHILDDYADTIRWLEKVRKNEITPDLPLKVVAVDGTDGGDGTGTSGSGGAASFLFGSNTKRKIQW